MEVKDVVRGGFVPDKRLSPRSVSFTSHRWTFTAIRRPFSVVWNSYYGMLKEQILYTNFPPYPMRAIWNNRIQKGRRIEHSMYKYSNVAVSTTLQIYYCNYPLPLNSQKRLALEPCYNIEISNVTYSIDYFFIFYFFWTCRQLSVISY